MVLKSPFMTEEMVSLHCLVRLLSEVTLLSGQAFHPLFSQMESLRPECYFTGAMLK
jgi:hypothetical protein